MVTQEVEAIDNVGDVRFLQRKFQLELLPQYLTGFFSYLFRFGFCPVAEQYEIIGITGQDTISRSSLASLGFLVRREFAIFLPPPALSSPLTVRYYPVTLCDMTDLHNSP